MVNNITAKSTSSSSTVSTQLLDELIADADLSVTADDYEKKMTLKVENDETDDDANTNDGGAVVVVSDDTDKKDETDKEQEDVKHEEAEEEDEESKQRRLEEQKAKEEAERKRIEELKKKYADWPLRNIKDVHENDVMYGRGGGTNHHPGNKRYRKMVEDRKLEYVNSKRLDKPLVALDIIRTWRSQLPPGRFLKIDEKTGLWHDVGDKKAREKTSQALREKAPMIRKQQEEEEDNFDDDDDDDDHEDGADSGDKMTRFADGTKGESKSKVKKAVLARDHSLGREYLGKDEAVTLDGFTWQDPFKKEKPKETSVGGIVVPGAGPYSVPAGRTGSSGSIGMMPPYHQTSFGAPPPPPPDYYGRVASGEPRREFSNGSFGSWGPYHSFSFPPPPPGHTMHAMHNRSGSWTQSLGPPPPHPHGVHHQRSGSWGSGVPPGREHSLSYNPLAGAHLGSPGNRAAFDGRSGSGYWGDSVRPHPPPPPPSYYGGIPYMSSGSFGGFGPPHPGYGPPPPVGTHSNTPSPPYVVDMDIARTWSGGEVRTASWSSGPGAAKGLSPNSFNDRPPQQPPSPPAGPVPRPDIVKRDTSNQNEQPMIKKAALNRDQSATSNRLKREYLGPEYFNREMQTLQETTEQIRLSPSGSADGATVAQTSGNESHGTPKPQNITIESRMTTADVITMELLARPSPLLTENRVSTMDALDLDLDGDDAAISTDDLDKVDVSEVAAGGDGQISMPKPPSLRPQNRLTTQEFIDIVSGPLVSISQLPIGDDDDDPLPLS